MKKICWIFCLVCFTAPATETEVEILSSSPCETSSCLEPLSTSREFRSRRRARPDSLIRSGRDTRPVYRRKVEPHDPADVLEQRVAVHFDSIALERLLGLLVPEGWRIRFDVSAKKIEHRFVFHAETTRRRAIQHLLSRAGLDGEFYQHSQILLISGLVNG